VSVALIIQHAMCMNRTLLPPVACPALPHSPALSRKRHDFREGDIEHERVF